MAPRNPRATNPDRFGRLAGDDDEEISPMPDEEDFGEPDDKGDHPMHENESD